MVTVSEGVQMGSEYVVSSSFGRFDDGCHLAGVGQLRRQVLLACYFVDLRGKQDFSFQCGINLYK